VVGLLGNLLLIPACGLVGAAISTSAAMVVSAVLLRVLVRSRVGVKI